MDSLFNSIIHIPSVSGNETPLQEFIKKEVSPYGDVKTDVLGNIIAKIGTGSTKIMIDAHMDEVGFIITYIDEKGFAYFKPLGGIEKDICVGQKVKIITSKGDITGCIAKNEGTKITSTSPIKDMWIDVGTSNGASLIQVGDYVYFDSYCNSMQDQSIMARGADNKIGIYILLQLCKHITESIKKKISVYPVFSTQEELGLFGATVAAEKILPTYAFIIETIDATDIPGGKVEAEGNIIIGKGLVLTKGPKTDTVLYKMAKDIAEKKNIPFQIVAHAEETSTTTDTIQINNTGVRTLLISIPVRYMHTPNVVFNWKDVEAIQELINEILSSL